jgi:exonuclease III
MRVMSWNMNGAGGIAAARLETCWTWLEEQRDVDVLLLQEAVLPGWESRTWPVVIHHPKASAKGSCGTALLSRTTGLEPVEPGPDNPWLLAVRDSVALARPTTTGGRWFASLHSAAVPMSAERTEGLDLSSVALCDPKGVWEVDLLMHGLAFELGRDPFVVGGDLNSSLVLDTQRRPANAVFFETVRRLGFIDARPRIPGEPEPQTFFGGRSRPMQLDYLYVDSATSREVTAWTVHEEIRQGPGHMSDHLPVSITLP